MTCFFNNLLPEVKKMRDETARCCEDVVMSDGTVIYLKDQGLEIVNGYDELLDTLKRKIQGD